MTSHQHLRVSWLSFQLALQISLFYIVTSHCAPITDVIDGSPQDEIWLIDESFYDLLHDDDHPQADGRNFATNDLCPPVPRRLPVGGCDVESCNSDRECVDRHLKCCYNGCVYTCLPEMKPPPYLDWIREPVRRLQFGQSWLVPGPNFQLDGPSPYRRERQQVELCSTTPLLDDSDPLYCPHGYECSINDVGRPAEGIPNRGHCVKIVEESTPESNLELAELSGSRMNYADTTPEDKEEASQEDTASLHACRLEKERIVLSGHSVRLGGRTCLCHETRLHCNDLPVTLTT